MHNLTKDEWSEWRQHPVTKAFFSVGADELEHCRKSMGSFLMPTADETALRYAEACGYIAGVEDFLNLRPEEDDDEVEGTG